MAAVQFWEERYASRPQVWSGRANQVLVDLVSGFTPRTALDLGCGEGGDAVWLAQQGWRVTAVDISTTAVERGRAAAADLGVPADRITWVAQDLAEWSPGGTFDLVSAFFLQSPVELPRDEILRRAAGAVAPGGYLLLVTHAAPPPWATALDSHHHDFHTPDEELEALGLRPTEWEALVAETRQRSATGPDGQPADLEDAIVLARRHSSPHVGDTGE
ncbi:tRNA 5-carboxymethoxyuridine methyltransferase [Propionicimonas sp. T2.31MG-18]|uniref:class I SAM-dependent methyltransferase n=1 Tax=Propionicimonas sp. T2.31MG-18 TaxID=3157620 RepID=UPI0035E82058